MSEAQSPKPTRTRKAAPHNTVVMRVPVRLAVEQVGVTLRAVPDGFVLSVPVREPVIQPSHSASDLGKWGIVIALIVSAAVSVMGFGTLFLLGRNAGVL